MSDAVSVVVTGVVSLGCKRCAALREALTEAFAKHGIVLEFAPIVWDYEPETAAKFSLDNGIEDIPAFVVGGKVFKDGFTKPDVDAVARRLSAD